MIKTIKHGINLAKHYFRDVGLDAKRSGKWPTVERHFLEAHSVCAACGSKNRLNVHHIHPFHIHPELELDPNNLITLCMDTKECHLHLGHNGNFKFYNPNIRHDANEALLHPDKFDEIVKRASNNRLVN
jgi:5-methylcytosine-specific restriction protein A